MRSGVGGGVCRVRRLGSARARILCGNPNSCASGTAGADRGTAPRVRSGFRSSKDDPQLPTPALSLDCRPFWVLSRVRILATHKPDIWNEHRRPRALSTVSRGRPEATRSGADSPQDAPPRHCAGEEKRTPWWPRSRQKRKPPSSTQPTRSTHWKSPKNPIERPLAGIGGSDSAPYIGRFAFASTCIRVEEPSSTGPYPTVAPITGSVQICTFPVGGPPPRIPV